jgi:hypothetical protein
MDKLARKARGTKKGELMPVSIVEAYKGGKRIVLIMTGFSLWTSLDWERPRPFIIQLRLGAVTRATHLSIIVAAMLSASLPTPSPVSAILFFACSSSITDSSAIPYHATATMPKIAARAEKMRAMTPRVVKPEGNGGGGTVAPSKFSRSAVRAAALPAVGTGGLEAAQAE